jgi:bifunctional non-homologous end joining protein LigD
MIKLLNREKDNEVLDVDGRVIKLTNLNKVFWPDEGFTKGDLVDYYLHISSYLLPYLANRPESLRRYPDGIKGKSFFQKDVAGLVPDWIDTINIRSGSRQENTRYMICNNVPSLLFMINLGCIDINPWNSSTSHLDKPDYLILDLDPIEVNFDWVLKTALVIKEICDHLKIKSYPKTSGARGLHVYIPMNAQYSYKECRNFARLLAELVHEKTSAYTSLEREPQNRRNKVYIDYLQNSKGQTLAAPYSVRPRPGATVSTPVTWKEVESGIKPNDFTITSIPRRIERSGDIFLSVLGEGVKINEVLSQLNKNVHF